MFDTIYIHGYQTSDGHKPTLKERATVRKTCGPYRLRPRDPRKSDGIGFYQSSRDLSMGDGVARLRLEWANDHLSGRLSDIRGYYTTEDGAGDTLKPIIARLPHGRGYLAGWTMGKGMCASLETSTIYADVEDAARNAHYEAERTVEREVEADIAYREAQELAERLEDEMDSEEETLA